MISVFDIFKVGIGPSSSHTVGPMKAGKQFTDDLCSKGLLSSVIRIVVEVYGSLSLTGKGHHTDIAIIMGLAGYLPETVDTDAIAGFIMRVNETQKLPLAQSVHEVDFLRNGGMIFHLDNLPLHENGLRIHAYANDREVYSQTYYSIGGGFIVDEAHFGQESADSQTVPYPFKSAAELMEQCQRSGMSLSGLVLQNELAWHTKAEIEQYFMQIWRTMTDCMQKGLNTEGILPGPLRVTRRAPSLQRILTSSDTLSVDPMGVIDWVNLFALAVSEENAAGGRVVTAPTNGACGIIPAVLAYYGRFIQPLTSVLIIRYFMASGVIGILYKANASISGAEVGCQGEVGVACSMAASGLAELMGGNPAQVCSAAEIGMEHNLGLTCDPVAGQVQVPCIERNAIAAVQAINAARMALQRTTAPYVSLDNVIETMYETGKDLNPKYRETSRGGLAIKITMCE
ncbi:L-serine ammonia-lyase [Budvicia aquatica]|uniref:L-serine dehydratase n=2 Tax=Budvicia aquatica TaxID=82979 RepID=A0A2C6DHK7_9GAMM|nr:L-serine ammonia-lyase [Budvicia aquatica]PHI28243.1 L-serine ammonia-lyase [Budvicia aquatica]